MLRCGRLAEMVKVSRQQIHRLARVGRIPGAKRTRGGQFYFVECPALGDWIAGQRSRKIAAQRKKWPRGYALAQSLAVWVRKTEKTPICRLRPEYKNKLRELLEPAARALWPDKFR